MRFFVLLCVFCLPFALGAATHRVSGHSKVESLNAGIPGNTWFTRVGIELSPNNNCDKLLNELMYKYLDLKYLEEISVNNYNILCFPTTNDTIFLFMEVTAVPKEEQFSEAFTQWVEKRQGSTLYGTTWKLSRVLKIDFTKDISLKRILNFDSYQYDWSLDLAMTRHSVTHLGAYLGHLTNENLIFRNPDFKTFQQYVEGVLPDEENIALFRDGLENNKANLVETSNWPTLKLDGDVSIASGFADGNFRIIQ